MNDLTNAYVFILLGVIPDSAIIHKYYNSERFLVNKTIKKGLLWQTIGIVIQVLFGVIGLFLQANYFYSWIVDIFKSPVQG